MHLPVYFLSCQTSFLLSSFLFLSPSMFFEINIFFSAFTHINPFPCYPSICCIFSNSLKPLLFSFCCFLVSFPPPFLSVLSFSLSPCFILGAGCLPASCRECQQDVFCHHRPVEDQQHVPLQSCFFSAPLPKGSSGQEGDWKPHNSYSTFIFIQHSSVLTCLYYKIIFYLIVI